MILVFFFNHGFQSRMEINEDEHFQNHLIDVKQVQSFVINDEDEQIKPKEIENDNQSTTDTIMVTDEIEAVLNQKSNMAIIGTRIDDTEKNP